MTKREIVQAFAEYVNAVSEYATACGECTDTVAFSQSVEYQRLTTRLRQAKVTARWIIENEG